MEVNWTKVIVNSGSSISNRWDREVNREREETYEKYRDRMKKSGNRLPAILTFDIEASAYLCYLNSTLSFSQKFLYS